MLFELELDKVEAILKSLDTKVDKKGPFMVLGLSVATTKDVLAFFRPELPDETFMEVPDLVGGALVVKDEGVVYPQKRDASMYGATMEIAHGVGAPMAFVEILAEKFQFTPNPGGNVILAFDVIVRGHEQHVSTLYRLQDQQVTVSITPAVPPEMKAAA